MNLTETPQINKNGISQTNTDDFFKDCNLNPLFEPAEYIQPVQLYYNLTKKIPNRLIYPDIDIRNLRSELKKEKYLLQKIQSQEYSFQSDGFSLKTLLAIVRKDIMIFHSRMYHETVIYYSDSSEKEVIEDLNKIFQRCKKKLDEKTLCLIRQNHNDLELMDFSLKPITLNLEKNYNNDFLNVHDIIKSRLSKENDKGLILLHGKPGTGKTTYIRHLTGTVGKKMIYVPPDLASAIASPLFLSFLINHSNSILIIEDAENIVQNRRSGDNAAISNLLNLCDGLLSDCLNIQILCTFNNDISRIDKALLRKGRLIAQYEFGALEISKAQCLSDSLGFNNTITQPLTLAEIYNQNEKDFAEENNNKIGFVQKAELSSK